MPNSNDNGGGRLDLGQIHTDIGKLQQAVEQQNKTSEKQSEVLESILVKLGDLQDIWQQFARDKAVEDERLRQDRERTAKLEEKLEKLTGVVSDLQSSREQFKRDINWLRAIIGAVVTLAGYISANREWFGLGK